MREVGRSRTRTRKRTKAKTKRRRFEMAHPRFKISKNDGGEYTFNLTAANGEKILASERYTSLGAAEGGIAAVKVNAEIDGRYERRMARDGELYFVLKGGNGEIVGVSEMYTSGAAREQGMGAVKANAGVAGVEG
jgi:uncharacterized protein YegP (UPF0339 family)